MKKIGLLLTFVLLTGCTSVSIQDYQSEQPKLKLENYLNGNLDAYGIFQDRSGKVIKRFKVDMKATWKDGVGVLEEDFKYADGTTSRRVWTIKKSGENSYIGTAADVVGEAKGEVAGNALQWKYTMDLVADGENYKVQFDDWMYLMDDKIMLNKSKMYKFGIYLGEITLTFVKK